MTNEHDDKQEWILRSRIAELEQAARELLEHAEEYLGFGNIGGKEGELRDRLRNLLGLNEPSPEPVPNNSDGGKA